MNRWTASAMTIGLLAVAPALAPIAPAPGAWQDHVPRLPILIEGNEALTPENGVTGGAGTAEDPFIISGWLIEGHPYPLRGSAIEIRNTTRPILVTDNVVSSTVPGRFGFAAGVFVHNVHDVEIRGNEVLYSNLGILALESARVQVVGNTVSGAPPAFFIISVGGISVVRTTDSSIRGNTVDLFANALTAQQSSDRAVIEDNVVTRTLGFGGVAIYGDDRPLARKNTVSCCGGGGFQVHGNRNATVSDNRIEGVHMGIIVIEDGFTEPPTPDVDATISRNRFNGNDWGIDIECRRCRISHNEIARNDRAGFFYGTEVNISHNQFTDNADGLRAWREAVLYRNNIESPTGTLLWANSTIDARFNWWGSPDGPAERVRGTTPVAPWLRDRESDAGPTGSAETESSGGPPADEMTKILGGPICEARPLPNTAVPLILCQSTFG